MTINKTPTHKEIRPSIFATRVKLPIELERFSFFGINAKQEDEVLLCASTNFAVVFVRYDLITGKSKMLFSAGKIRIGSVEIAKLAKSKRYRYFELTLEVSGDGKLKADNLWEFFPEDVDTSCADFLDWERKNAEFIQEVYKESLRTAEIIILE